MVNKSKFNLIENAHSSLQHAVNHLTNPDGIDRDDVKYAIRDVTQVVELLLKEYLQRIHPCLIWQDVDKYPSLEANVISLGKAGKRIINVGGMHLGKEFEKTIVQAKKIRDTIEHFECVFDKKEAEIIIGRMLSFVFNFSKKYLEIDLEGEFRKDDRWESLISMYEFWNSHKDVVEKEMKEKDLRINTCSNCGAETFDMDKEECCLCGHFESVVYCDICHGEYLESEIDIAVDADFEQEGPIGAEQFRICIYCREKSIDEY